MPIGTVPGLAFRTADARASSPAGGADAGHFWEEACASILLDAITGRRVMTLAELETLGLRREGAVLFAAIAAPP